MCLIVFAWHAHPDYPLVLVGNRDEFYARRTRAAAWWGQAVSVLAGRDEEAGGTWLGITRSGRLAALTNVRGPRERNTHAPSRGGLALAALQSDDRAGDWLEAQAARGGAFNGYNLLLGDVSAAPGSSAGLHHHSNRGGAPARALDAGVYGLSNAGLDTPWPKLTRAVARFACQIAQRVDADRLLELFADRTRAADLDLPITGVPMEWERALSAIQIRTPGYGTRSTTVLTVRADGQVSLLERSFSVRDPEQHADRHFEFQLPRIERRHRREPRTDAL
jgi:uncharacterized protein with NRDE domain